MENENATVVFDEQETRSSSLVAERDSFQLPENAGPVPFNVLANDLLTPGASIVSFTTPTGGGQVELNGDHFVFTPDQDVIGVYTFQYTISDGVESSTDTVAFRIDRSHEQTHASIDDRYVEEISPSGLTLEIERYAQLPDTEGFDNDMITFALQGERQFVTVVGRNPGTSDPVSTSAHIYEINDDGTMSLFFDVDEGVRSNSSHLVDVTSPIHGGLRGVAFHPDFETNGLFYTSSMQTRPADPSAHHYVSDVADPAAADSVLNEWRVDLTTGEVDPAYYREVFRVGVVNIDHTIRDIVFNPYADPADADYGLLYIGHGDGSTLNVTAGTGLANDALGKILRIDPLQDGTSPYSIPADNPFVGSTEFPEEVYAVGERNPHHLAFVETETGGVHLLSSNIGEDDIEEVNIIVPGGNYGWADREGNFVHLPSGGILDGVDVLPSDDSLNEYIYPALAFSLDDGPENEFAFQALAGGYVVTNGSELDGEYIFADFSRSSRAFHASFEDMLGAVTTLDPNDPLRDEPDELTFAQAQQLTILFDHDNDDTTTPIIANDLDNIIGAGRSDVRFGQGADGELYIINKQDGWVYLVTNSVAPEPNAVIGGDLTGSVIEDDIDGTADPLGGLVGLFSDSTLDGGAGNDTILGGQGDDLLTGGLGDDILLGGVGADIVIGGPGNDTLFTDDPNSADLATDVLVGGYGSDLFIPGNDDFGNDVILDFSAGDTLRFNSAGTSMVTGQTLVLTQVGVDVEVANTVNSSTILLMNVDINDLTIIGDDVISTAGGAFLRTDGVLTISDSDPNEDAFVAGTVSGAYGQLSLDGSGVWSYVADNSQLAIQELNAGEMLVDFIPIQSVDGTTADIAITINGIDEPAVFNVIDGTDGSDNLNGTQDADLIIGRDGNDSIRGLREDDSLLGGSGGDTLLGESGNDTLEGGSGRDSLRGSVGDDVLSGGADNDRLNGDSDKDFIDGGAGFDIIVGGSGDDTITDFSDRSRIEANAGNDLITTAGDADTIVGGAGDDTIFSGGGNDNIGGGKNNDSLEAGDGNDDINGGTGDDTVIAGDGDDFVQASAGNDSVDGGVGVDTLLGKDGNDTLLGNDGNDRISAFIGDDLIDGGDGDDVIFDGRDNDTIIGGTGNDTLTLAKGNDVIVIHDGDGVELVEKFDSLGNDVLEFRGFGEDFDTAQEIFDAATQVGNTIVIDFGDGQLVHVGERAENFTIDDIVVG